MGLTAASEQGYGPAIDASGRQRVAVVAQGQDQELILDMLAGFPGDVNLLSLEELTDEIANERFAAAIITDGVLQSAQGKEVRRALDRQPPWSYLPFILIADRTAFENMPELLEKLGEVAIVERPIHQLVLANALHSALRACAREREAAAFLLQHHGADEHLRQLTTRLETRIRERMQELRLANQRLMEEARGRSATEERLRESEELYRYTVELSRQIVWTASPDGKFLTVSPRFYEVIGASEQGDLREIWLRAHHPDDVPQSLAFSQRLRVSKAPEDTQFRMRVADGTYRTFLARAAPRLDEEGKVVRWYGFTQDVTDQVRADEERRAAEERYRLAAKATNDAIWDIDFLAAQIHWTASETAFFGYRIPEEVTSICWWKERVHPADRQRVTKSFEGTIAGSGSHWEETYRFLKADGGYADVFDQGFIIRNDAGKAVRMVGALSDLSEYSRAEAEIRKIQAELIHVSRVSAMGTMASTLAHELNQPLTAVSSYIRGSLHLLDQQDSASRGQVRSALEAAEAAALRAGHIVRRLRELVARGNVSPRPELLAKVIEDASLIAFLDEHLLGATHSIELDPEAEWVEVDAIQIQQVVINLVRNALQALDGHPRREIIIRTSLLSKGTAEVSIADTGPGIAAEVRDALFSPFQSTRFEGMGIGLSISRTIVEAHGGKIWAEDAPGGGTVFRFTLPRVQAPGEQ